MYEKHFGLKSRPFGAKAAGAGVFVGPQQARIMTSVAKGLGASDAVVIVTGPVGVGKSTIVGRALESISPGRMVAWVGRMHLAPDEMLELLLTGFGVNRQIKGTVQRFAAFRRLLAERAAAGAQVAIVVEDAHRIGVDALVELEALTAADTGDSTSANIILIGRPDLAKLLSLPDLDRMRQRNRLRQQVTPFSEAEVSGYMKHCIRQAGSNYEEIFDTGVAEIVFGCSEGVPRMINTLCESALTAAVAEGAPRVTMSLMRQVAMDAFAYDSSHIAGSRAVDHSGQPSQADVVATAVADKLSNDGSGPDTDDIPDLINDTQPELQKIKPDSEEIVSTEVESTQTQKTLPEPFADCTPEPDSADGAFSLDDALAVDVEETNVMPGITPNLDQLAAEAKRAGDTVAAAAKEPTENIPTLSNSMRIDVAAEVKRAGSGAADREKDALPNDVKKQPSPTAAPAAAAGVAKAPPEQRQEKVRPAHPGNHRTSAGTTSGPEVARQAENTGNSATQQARQLKPATATEPVSQRAAGVARKAAGTVLIDSPDVAVKGTQPKVSQDQPGDPPTAADAWSNISDPDEAESETVREMDEPAEPLGIDFDDSVLTASPQATQDKPETSPAREKRTPDLDALQAALDAAKKGDFALQPDAGLVDSELPNDPPGNTRPAQEVSGVPKITLDNSLPKKGDQDDELRRVAEQIGRAHSLEDITDVMAETIFGSQAFDEIAAAVVANPPQNEAVSRVMLKDAELPQTENESTRKNTQDSADSPLKVDESAAKRLDMVKALNTRTRQATETTLEEIEIGSGNPDPAPSQGAGRPRGPQPEPIENQIDTSMTQTLQALSSAQVKKRAEQDEDNKKSSGLFSRFRKSS
jgi:type II secretory pathway predicted ATPase ExeA